MNDSAMQLKIEFQDSAEIPEIVDFSVAWSKAHDYIDLGMFSLPKMTEFYSEKSLTARKVSLHRIKDTGLITEITRLALFFLERQ